jgi:hypothetical protein
LIAVAPVLRQSCMQRGPIPPAVKLIAGRGSGDERRRPRPGRPGAVDVPGLHPGQAPNPGYELTVAHQHRRRQPPPGPRPATDAQAASDRMSDFAASPWCARSGMLTCFCPFAVDAAVSLTTAAPGRAATGRQSGRLEVAGRRCRATPLRCTAGSSPGRGTERPAGRRGDPVPAHLGTGADAGTVRPLSVVLDSAA